MFELYKVENLVRTKVYDLFINKKKSYTSIQLLDLLSRLTQMNSARIFSFYKYAWS